MGILCLYIFLLQFLYLSIYIKKISQIVRKIRKNLKSDFQAARQRVRQTQWVFLRQQKRNPVNVNNAQCAVCAA